VQGGIHINSLKEYMAACIYQLGKTRTEQKYEHPLKKFYSLNLEAAALFHKRLHHFAIVWENGYSII
jgi:hypothetical protein